MGEGVVVTGLGGIKVGGVTVFGVSVGVNVLVGVSETFMGVSDAGDPQDERAKITVINTNHCLVDKIFVVLAEWFRIVIEINYGDNF